jgi:hypothetical protein
VSETVFNPVAFYAAGLGLSLCLAFKVGGKSSGQTLARFAADGGGDKTDGLG